MIVLDIDGTLLDRQGIIPEMIYLVRELEKKGMVVSLASGRTLPKYHSHSSITRNFGVHCR